MEAQADGEVEHVNAREVRRGLAAWWGLLGGPIAWVLHLQVAYALVPWVCLTKKHWVLHAVGIGFLLLTATAALAALGTWRKEGREWPSGMQEGKSATRRIMGAVGVMAAALFFMIIVGQQIATFFIDPCQD